MVFIDIIGQRVTRYVCTYVPDTVFTRCRKSVAVHGIVESINTAGLIPRSSGIFALVFSISVDCSSMLKSLKS